MLRTSNRPVDWEALVTQNEDRLYRAALAILGDPQEAEDAVQDAFVRFLEKAPDHLENPSAWLMRVLVNGCRSRLRLAWRGVLHGGAGANAGLPPGDRPLPPVPGPGAAEEAVGTVERARPTGRKQRGEFL